MSDQRKKVVAFSAGRKGGNTEIYIKAALEVIAAKGIDVELIRLNECNIHPCVACKNGKCNDDGPQGCIFKDDVPWLAEKFLDSDGYILGAPVWSLSPCGIVSDFRDRVFGPKMDAALWEMAGVPEWVKGRKKHRPGGLISVGGALTENWTSLGMATLYTTTFSTQTNIVDHMNVSQVADMGEALLRKDYMQQAKDLGEHVAQAVLDDATDWEGKWLGGDKGGACPGCNMSLIIAKPGADHVECAICGRSGKLQLDENGKFSYTWPENDPKDRLRMPGKFDHIEEIIHHSRDLFAPHASEIEEEYEYYKKLETFTVKAPSRQPKK